MKKFEKAKALLSNKNGKPSYENVLEAALDEFLKDHDPENRKQRRDERKEKAEARTKSGGRAAKNDLAIADPRGARQSMFRRGSAANRIAPLHSRRHSRRRLRAGQEPLHLHRLDRKAVRGHAQSSNRSHRTVRAGRHGHTRQSPASLRETQQARSRAGPGREHDPAFSRERIEDIVPGIRGATIGPATSPTPHCPAVPVLSAGPAARGHDVRSYSRIARDFG